MASRVVLGLGGCVDYELRLSSSTLQQLVAEYEIRDSELALSVPVADERNLIISVLAHMKHGAGGEHFAASSETLLRFARRFATRISLGGTSVRAALAMSRLGVPCTLHLVSLNDHVRRLLPLSCDYISSARDDTLDPHLVVQYDQGTRIQVGDIDMQTPFPNRLIYVNDPANASLALSEQLGSQLRDAGIFLISGFNTMRDQDSCSTSVCPRCEGTCNSSRPEHWSTTRTPRSICPPSAAECAMRCSTSLMCTA